MKVFVTGATGFVGKVVTQALLESHGIEEVENTQVRALVRDPESPRVRELLALPHAEGNLEVVKGDVLDPTSLAEALEDGEVDAVIHLVGIIAERPMAGVTFKRIHAVATRNVVDATRNAGIDRYVHMSALGTGPDSEARYHRTKWEAEEYVRASGLDFTIFRPSIVFGAEDLFINRFAWFIETKLFGTPLPNYGRTKFQPVAVEDVAEAFAQALEVPASVGKTYDLCGTKVVTLRELVELIEDILGTWSLKAPMPLGLARLNARLLQFAPYPFDLNPDQVTMMKKDNVGDNGPLLADFDMELTPLREGIAAYLAPEAPAVHVNGASQSAAAEAESAEEPESETAAAAKAEEAAPEAAETKGALKEAAKEEKRVEAAEASAKPEAAEPEAEAEAEAEPAPDKAAASPAAAVEAEPAAATAEKSAKGGKKRGKKRGKKK